MGQCLLKALLLRRNLAQVHLDMSYLRWIIRHGFGLEQVILCLIKVFILVYKYLGQGDARLKTILKSQ